MRAEALELKERADNLEVEMINLSIFDVRGKQRMQEVIDALREEIRKKHKKIDDLRRMQK